MVLPRGEPHFRSIKWEKAGKLNKRIINPSSDDRISNFRWMTVPRGKTILKENLFIL